MKKPLKSCDACHREYPNTAEYFRHKGDGYLDNLCLPCRRERARLKKQEVARQAREWIKSRRVEVNGRMDCKYCTCSAECARRVRLGAWVKCEIPEVDDLHRIFLVAPEALPEMLELAEVLNVIS
jgi:hypothetical protein